MTTLSFCAWRCFQQQMLRLWKQKKKWWYSYRQEWKRSLLKYCPVVHIWCTWQTYYHRLCYAALKWQNSIVRLISLNGVACAWPPYRYQMDKRDVRLHEYWTILKGTRYNESQQQDVPFRKVCRPHAQKNEQRIVWGLFQTQKSILIYAKVTEHNSQ